MSVLGDELADDAHQERRRLFGRHRQHHVEAGAEQAGAPRGREAQRRRPERDDRGADDDRGGRAGLDPQGNRARRRGGALDVELEFPGAELRREGVEQRSGGVARPARSTRVTPWCASRCASSDPLGR